MRKFQSVIGVAADANTARDRAGAIVDGIFPKQLARGAKHLKVEVAVPGCGETGTLANTAVNHEAIGCRTKTDAFDADRARGLVLRKNAVFLGSGGTTSDAEHQSQSYELSREWDEHNDLQCEWPPPLVARSSMSQSVSTG